MEKNFFLVAPFAIFGDSTLSGNAKWILIEIISLLKVDRRYCWASNDHFAELFGLTKTNVSYHIHELERAGWIKVEVVKECNLPDCPLKDKGWHRHIHPLPPLSKILESLSKRLDSPIQNIGEPIQSTASIRITNEKDNNKNNMEEEEVAAPPKKVNRICLSRSQMIALQREFPGLSTSEVKEQVEKCNNYMAISSRDYSNPGLFFRGWLKRYVAEKKETGSR